MNETGGVLAGQLNLTSNASRSAGRGMSWFILLLLLLLWPATDRYRPSLCSTLIVLAQLLSATIAWAVSARCLMLSTAVTLSAPALQQQRHMNTKSSAVFGCFIAFVCRPLQQRQLAKLNRTTKHSWSQTRVPHGVADVLQVCASGKQLSSCCQVGAACCWQQTDAAGPTAAGPMPADEQQSAGGKHGSGTAW